MIKKIKEGFTKLALKGMIKSCEKLIAKDKVLDLDGDDVNDLIEGKEGCQKALDYQEKKKELNKEERA